MTEETKPEHFPIEGEPLPVGAKKIIHLAMADGTTAQRPLEVIMSNGLGAYFDVTGLDIVKGYFLSDVETDKGLRKGLGLTQRYAKGLPDAQ